MLWASIQALWSFVDTETSQVAEIRSQARTFQFQEGKIMATDNLTTSGTKVSASMLLTLGNFPENWSSGPLSLTRINFEPSMNE